MSMKRLAVIAAVNSHNSFSNQSISYFNTDTNQPSGFNKNSNNQGLQTMRPGANLHGNVNIMLGGAMLSLVITIVCFVCYCCHRSIKKRSASVYRQQWMETDANMEIYSVEQCYDASGLFMDGTTDGLTIPSNIAGPPPSYDAVLAADVAASRHKNSDNCPDYDDKYKTYDCKCDSAADYTDLMVDTENYNNIKFTSADLMAIPWRFHNSESLATGNSSMMLCDCTIMDTNEQSRCRSCGQVLLKITTNNNDCSRITINTTDESMSNNSLSEIQTHIYGNQCTYAECENISNNNSTQNHHNPVIVEEETENVSDQSNHDLDHIVIADTNQNFPSTSSYQQHLNLNNNNNNDATIATIDQISNENNIESITDYGNKKNYINDNSDDNMNVVDLDEMNGMVKLDMSQIIDKTGLPTYEAALKLESSGYV